MRQLGSVEIQLADSGRCKGWHTVMIEANQWRRSSVEILIQGADILARPRVCIARPVGIAL